MTNESKELRESEALDGNGQDEKSRVFFGRPSKFKKAGEDRVMIYVSKEYTDKVLPLANRLCKIEISPLD